EDRRRDHSRRAQQGAGCPAGSAACRLGWGRVAVPLDASRAKRLRGPVSFQEVAGRADHAVRRLAQRRGRERGCWVYIDAEQLAKTGVELNGEPPAYRTWAGPRGRVVVQLYREA